MDRVLGLIMEILLLNLTLLIIKIDFTNKYIYILNGY